TQGLCQRDDVRLQVPMLEAKHFASAAESGLHFIGNQQCSVFAAKLLRADKEIGVGRFAAFPLNRLNDKSCNVARTQLSIQRFDIFKRHTRIETFHERPKSFRETFAPHQRQRTETEPVKRALERNSSLATRCSTRKF